MGKLIVLGVILLADMVIGSTLVPSEFHIIPGVIAVVIVAWMYVITRSMR